MPRSRTQRAPISIRLTPLDLYDEFIAHTKHSTGDLTSNKSTHACIEPAALQSRKKTKKQFGVKTGDRVLVAMTAKRFLAMTERAARF